MKTEEKVKCPYEKKCGGCKYQGIPYEKQLKEKEKKVRKLLKDYGKPEPILSMEDPYYYRNKVHATYKHMRNGDIAVEDTKKAVTDWFPSNPARSKIRKPMK